MPNIEKIKKTGKERGAALYLTMMILAVVSASFFTLTGVLVSQIKITGNLSNSVMAFAAADAGIEDALYKIRRQDYSSGTFSGTLSNGGSYTVTVVLQGSLTVARSVGVYQNSRRALEIQF
ncbi:MAG: hypothetical protein PHU56_00725 [Candidatus Pacebacteria bacterium]|nr:hypothetical protein [Candidatus Paceibacterota bacterium]